MNIPRTLQERIVIVGAGFAGIALAKKLIGSNYQVVLLDKNNFHTFQPLLYQVATSGLEPDSIAYPVRKIFQNVENFFFRIASVDSIEADSKRLHTNKGILHYDHLVLATGATTNYFGNKTLEALSMSMKSVTEALDLRSLLIQNLEEASEEVDEQRRKALMNIVIVGAGPTGVELAGSLAELKAKVLPQDYPDLDFDEMSIVLVQGADRVLPSMSQKASKASLKYLKELGVEVWLNKIVKDYDGHCIVTDKETIPARTLIWAAGVKGNPVANVGEVNRGGRIEIDEFFRVNSEKNIYSIGDVASMTSEDNPRGHAMMASVATQQGEFLGGNFRKMEKGATLKPYQHKDKGAMATIGRNRAVADFSRMKFSGTFAWYLWMFVHLFLLVGFRNRLVAFIDWAYSYITYDTGIRLIIRPFKRKIRLQEQAISSE